jgi:hypothetical protein
MLLVEGQSIQQAWFWSNSDILGLSYGRFRDICIFGDLGRDLWPMVKQRVRVTTPQGALHDQSNFDRQYKDFFLRLFIFLEK